MTKKCSFCENKATYRFVKGHFEKYCCDDHCWELGQRMLEYFGDAAIRYPLEKIRREK